MEIARDVARWSMDLPRPHGHGKRRLGDLLALETNGERPHTRLSHSVTDRERAVRERADRGGRARRAHHGGAVLADSADVIRLAVPTAAIVPVPAAVASGSAACHLLQRVQMALLPLLERVVVVDEEGIVCGEELELGRELTRGRIVRDAPRVAVTVPQPHTDGLVAASLCHAQRPPDRFRQASDRSGRRNAQKQRRARDVRLIEGHVHEVAACARHRKRRQQQRPAQRRALPAPFEFGAHLDPKRGVLDAHWRV